MGAAVLIGMGVLGELVLVDVGGDALAPVQLYDRLKRWLRIFQRRDSREPVPVGTGSHTDVILIGLGRFGTHLADHLADGGYRVLAVDFDPHPVRSTTRQGINAMFGSAEDIHLLDALPLHEAKYVISAIPELETN